MRFFIAWIAITLAIYHGVQVKQVGYTESQRAAMDKLHAEAMELEPFGRLQVWADTMNITEDSLDSYKEWW